MENVQTGLMSSDPVCWTELTIFRPGRIQSGMNVKLNKYVSDRSQLRSLLRNNACTTKPCVKKQQWRARAINQKICDFRTGLM